MKRMAFCDVGSQAPKQKSGQSKMVYAGHHKCHAGVFIDLTLGQHLPVCSGVGYFEPSKENLDKLVESSKSAFEQYKATGKISGWTRVV